jgi:protein TonB
LAQVRPNYTPEAMQRRIQGTVILEVVVGRDGAPSAIRVARSLDPYGLDIEAIRAAQQWRFTPGRIGETPVEVLVKIVLEFRIQ